MKLSEQQIHNEITRIDNAVVCSGASESKFTETATTIFINLAKIFKQIHVRLAIEGKLPDNMANEPIKL